MPDEWEKLPDIQRYRLRKPIDLWMWTQETEHGWFWFVQLLRPIRSPETRLCRATEAPEAAQLAATAWAEGHLSDLEDDIGRALRGLADA